MGLNTKGVEERIENAAYWCWELRDWQDISGSKSILCSQGRKDVHYGNFYALTVISMVLPWKIRYMYKSCSFFCFVRQRGRKRAGESVQAGITVFAGIAIVVRPERGILKRDRCKTVDTSRRYG